MHGKFILPMKALSDQPTPTVAFRVRCNSCQKIGFMAAAE